MKRQAALIPLSREHHDALRAAEASLTARAQARQQSFGRAWEDVARLVLERGGHLHVGLEFYRGDRTPTNVELVSEAVKLCQRIGRPVASPDQAALLLGIPAADQRPARAT